MEHLLSKECIFYNPITTNCHWVGQCGLYHTACLAQGRKELIVNYDNDKDDK